MELIASPSFWVLASVAVLLAGLSKGGLGGAGGVATPLIALAVPPAQAAAVMLPVLCVLDIFGIRAYLWRWDRRVLRIVVSGGLAGCLAGALTFRLIDENWLRIMVGAIALAFLAWNLLPRRILLRRPSDTAGSLWSALAGYASFITHAGSPPLMVYLLPLRLEKAAFIATSLVFFAAMNYAKIVPYLWLGLFDARNLATSLVLAPVGVAGVYLGFWLQKRIPIAWFYRMLYTLMFVSGAKLLYDGVAGLR